MTRFSLRFSPLLIAFCLFASALLPCHAQAVYVPDVQKLINQSIPRSPGYAYKQGRVVTTDFSNQANTNNDFTFMNFGYTTDGSTPCIQATNTAVTDGSRPASSLITKDRFKDSEVFIKMKLTADPTFGLGYFPSATLRYMDATNNISLTTNGAGAGYLNAGNSYIASSNNFLTVTPYPVSLTDTTDYLYQRVQMFQNYCRVKTWYSTTQEPDWQSSGLANGSTSSICAIGSGGVTLRYSNARIYQVTVTELLRADDNLFHNADLSLLDTSGNPVWWAPKSGAPGASLESIPDRFGVVRPAFKVVTGGTFWEQALQSAADGKGAFSPNSLTPYPQSVLNSGPYLEFSCWTKGINLVNSSGINGSCFVMYYYDYNANIPNVTAGLTDYVANFNSGIPGTITNYGKGQVGTGTGLGTWDWTFTKFRFPLHMFSSIVCAQPDIGIHDSTTTGTVYIQDPCLRFVP